MTDRLLGVNGRAAESAAVVFQRYERAPLLETFAVQLVQRLRDQDPKITPALTWLENRLAAQGTTADTIVRDEHQKQGATNVSVRNIITSMRLISEADWTALFESVSLVDEILRSGSNFATMDFPTRNLYRSAIEELARSSRHTELEIARNAVLAAQHGTRRMGRDDEAISCREHDPGYYLVAGGRRAFEAKIGFRAPVQSWLRCFNAAVGIGGYIGSIILVSTVILALPLLVLAGSGLGGSGIGLLALLGLIPSIDAAIALVNRGIMRRFGANILPGLELRDGVPSHLRTMVVVPTLLTTRAALEEQIERLEIHHLASPEGDLYFAGRVRRLNHPSSWSTI